MNHAQVIGKTKFPQLCNLWTLTPTKIIIVLNDTKKDWITYLSNVMKLK
jgi:hypothetical protein